jgi:hypothetical protein
MAGSAGPILLVVLLFFCCCVSSVGGGLWWYTSQQTSNVVAETPVAAAAPTAPAAVVDSTIATSSNVANPSGLNFYKGSGLSFMKYTNVPNDPECAIGWNYYEKDKKKLILGNIPNITRQDDTQDWCARATPLPSVITTYSAAACQQSGALFIDDKLTCNDGVFMAGITWKWAVDNQSYACQQNCGGYIVTVVSAALPDHVLKWTMTSPPQSGAGIKGMPPPWYKGAITFTVMPVDKKGKNLLQVPVSKNVNIMQDQARCEQVGVFCVLPVPAWNENKNLIGVHVENTAGNFGGYVVYHKKSNFVYDAGTNMASKELSGFLKFGALALAATVFLAPVAIAVTVAMNEAGPKWGAGELVIVPKDGGITIICDGHIAGFQSWNDDATWDFMMKGGAANKQYTYSIKYTCWGGNAKSGDPYYAGWGDQTPPPPAKLPWGTIPKTKADAKKK